MHFAPAHETFIDEQAQHARIAEIEQAGEEGGAVHQRLLARGQHGQGGGQHGAAYAKAQHIEFFCAGSFQHLLHGGDDAAFDVVIPSHVGHFGIGVAPAQHECVMAFFNGEAHHGVIGLQIQNVVFVDASRNHEKRALVHLGRQGFVFDELKNLVFEHNGTFGERQIAPDLELAFVRHRNPAFFHVGQQVLHTAGNALALGVERFFLGIYIERKKIAGGCGCRPLLDGKAHAPAGLRIALQRIGQR